MKTRKNDGPIPMSPCITMCVALYEANRLQKLLETVDIIMKQAQCTGGKITNGNDK